MTYTSEPESEAIRCMFRDENIQFSSLFTQIFSSVRSSHKYSVQFALHTNIQLFILHTNIQFSSLFTQIFSSVRCSHRYSVQFAVHANIQFSSLFTQIHILQAQTDGSYRGLKLDIQRKSHLYIFTGKITPAFKDFSSTMGSVLSCFVTPV